MYKTNRWRAIRERQLAEHPLCAMHLQQGKHVRATVCDHVERHGGDEQRFFAGPFQSLCKACHDGPKQSQEHTGQMLGSDANGWPLDPNHFWNRNAGGGVC